MLTHVYIIIMPEAYHCGAHSLTWVVGISLSYFFVLV